MVASSRGWPGQTKAASGWPAGLTSSFLEGDALVAWQHRLPEADQAVAVAHRRRHVGHLVAARFPLAHRPAKPPEGLEEERLDIVGLQPPGLGALHLLAHALHPAGVHGVVHERPLFQEVLQLPRVHRIFHHLGQPRPHLGPLAVADGLNQQLAQGLPSNWSLPSTSNTCPPSAWRACSSLLSSVR
jgi:hypothetical protein